MRHPYGIQVNGDFRLTTNNRMELMAIIVGLGVLQRPCEVVVSSDSQYGVQAMQKCWPQRWKANGWRLADRLGKPGSGGLAKNPDLWARLLALCQRHRVTFRWIRGHSGHPDNERCDELAEAWARRSGLPADAAYEESQGTSR